jgi:hypothetical protein
MQSKEFQGEDERARSSKANLGSWNVFKVSRTSWPKSFCQTVEGGVRKEGIAPNPVAGHSGPGTRRAPCCSQCFDLDPLTTWSAEIRAKFGRKSQFASSSQTSAKWQTTQRPTPTLRPAARLGLPRHRRYQPPATKTPRARLRDGGERLCLLRDLG